MKTYTELKEMLVSEMRNADAVHVKKPITKASDIYAIESETRTTARRDQQYSQHRIFTVGGKECSLKLTNGSGRMSGGMMVIYYIEGKRASLGAVTALLDQKD